MMLTDCIQCMKCLSSCPVQAQGSKNFLSFILEQEGGNPWLCSNCWICHENCPQHINLWNTKAILQRECPPPAAIDLGLLHIKDYGLTVRFNTELNEMRSEMGLSPIHVLPPHIIQLLLGECATPIPKLNG